VRIIGITANTLVFFTGNYEMNWFGLELSIFDWIGVAVSILLYSVAVLTTIRQGTLLSRADIAQRTGVEPPPEKSVSQKKIVNRKRAARSKSAGRTLAKSQSTGRGLGNGRAAGRSAGKTAGKAAGPD
jgi:hypothetical protein